MSDTGRIVQKLWSFCDVLRDDGLSYLDYIEQLTCLLFLKMMDERAALTGEEQPIPKGCRWADLSHPQMEGERLEAKYREILAKLGTEGGMLRPHLPQGAEPHKGPGEAAPPDRGATWLDKNPEGRWRSFAYDELIARDKVSLDLFWLRDESLEDSANLPDPDVLAEEIAEDLRAALEQIEEVLEDLSARRNGNRGTAGAVENPARSGK
jgi:HsdM N-terminal domain